MIKAPIKWNLDHVYFGISERGEAWWGMGYRSDKFAIVDLNVHMLFDSWFRKHISICLMIVN